MLAGLIKPLLSNSAGEKLPRRHGAIGLYSRVASKVDEPIRPNNTFEGLLRLLRAL